MRRFLILALPLLVLLIAVFNWTLERLGTVPDFGPLVGWRAGQAGLPAAYVLGAWTLEALALCAIFLLVAGRGGWALTSGLASGWIAWVFRGPLLVLTVAAASGRSASWWPFAWRWFVLYTIAGVLLAVLATLSPPLRHRRRADRQGAPQPPDGGPDHREPPANSVDISR